MVSRILVACVLTGLKEQKIKNNLIKAYLIELLLKVKGG
jgi:hypothetical protein